MAIGDAVGVDVMGADVVGDTDGVVDGVASGDFVGLPGSIGDIVGDSVTGDNVGVEDGFPVGELVVGD